ncbi:MAG: NAD(P)/FAD-dependent oxidoreductase [Propionibacteriaceae bacterium]|jgi:phytoene dehydrogenase-like protein|nr:NAD(P)/FAD-dependent oxidoreductase [Propionibacteriaceae bacterium]
MPNTHDVVVIGAGHNGLTAAAYLAKAGLDVAVVERQSYLGGGAITLETNVPEFKHDLASTAHIFIQANPLLRNDELGLKSKHGLKYVYADEHPCVSVVFPGGEHLSFYRDLDKTCASIATVSPRDAEAYRRFATWAQPILGMLIGGFFGPPPPFGGLFAQLDQPGPGRDLLRAMQMSCLDVLDDWFENDIVKAFLARYVSEIIVGPDDVGTGSFLFIMVPLVHTFGMGIPVGGSGALSAALARCVEANGGTILTNSTVAKVNLAGGRATGVTLESGETILAKKAVIGDVNVKQLPGLVGADTLGEDFVRQTNNTKASVFAGVNINLALSEAPKYGDPELDKSLLVELCGYLPQMRQAFDGFKYGLPATEMPGVVCATNLDPTRAPDGKHTLYAFQYEPYDLAQGTWDERKEEIADAVIANYSQYATNINSATILGRTVTSPADLARMNISWMHGDPLHLRNMIGQYFSHRPFAEAGYYRLPAEALYLCGPSTHPGGGVTGGARAAAMIVMEDLGIDFERVVDSGF